MFIVASNIFFKISLKFLSFDPLDVCLKGPVISAPETDSSVDGNVSSSANVFRKSTVLKKPLEPMQSHVEYVRFFFFLSSYGRTI
jgi:hypothetical protein